MLPNANNSPNCEPNPSSFSNVLSFTNQASPQVLFAQNDSEAPKEEPKEDDDIENIAKAVHKDSSTKITFNELGETISRIDLNAKQSNNIPTGTLSNLRSIVNDEESIGTLEKDVPTPSGMENCRFFIMKMLDEPFSGRNYPLKSHIKDNSAKNSNTPTTKPHEEKATNFSHFLKQNALVNYYDNSPVRKRDINPQKVKEKSEFRNEQDFRREDDKVRIETVDFEDQDEENNQEQQMQFSNFQVFPTNEPKEVLFKGKKSNTINEKNNYEMSNASKSSNNMFLNMSVNMNVVAPGFIDYGNMNNIHNNNNSHIKSMSTSDEQEISSFQTVKNTYQQNRRETASNKPSQYQKQKPQPRNINRAGLHPNSNPLIPNQIPQISYDQSFDLFMPNLANKQMNNPWNQNTNMKMNMFNHHLMPNNMPKQDFFMNPYMNQPDFYPQQPFPNSFIPFNQPMNSNPYLQQQQYHLQQQILLQQQQQQSYNTQFNQKKKSKVLMQNINTLPSSELIKNSNTICKDQTGCRFLQKKIDEDPNIVPQIIQNIFENAIEIIADPFGNYLIQKLFDYMVPDQLCQLMALIQIYISQICCNSYGTRVIQKLIDYLTTETLIRTFINLIKPVIKDIILNINGSHILLKLLDMCNPMATKVVYEEIIVNIMSIATHKHGCCVLQKCIEKAPPKITQKIISILIENCQELILDQCGNYIIQYIITLQNDCIHEGITDHLVIDILSFSKQKYSSNVVEKCFECCNDRICQKLLVALRDSQICIKLLFDKFGNYVIQKALQRADEEAQRFILNSIAPCIHKLKNYPFGMKLYNKLIITYPYLSQKMLKIDQSHGDVIYGGEDDNDNCVNEEGNNVNDYDNHE